MVNYGVTEMNFNEMNSLYLGSVEVSKLPLPDRTKRQMRNTIIANAMSHFGDAIIYATAGEAGMEVIRIPCGPKGFGDFPKYKIHALSLQDAREEAVTFLYNQFKKKGFKVETKIISTECDEYGKEYWKSIKIYWNARNKSNMQGSKRNLR